LARALGDAVPEAATARIDGAATAQGKLALPALKLSGTQRSAGLEVGGLGTERYVEGWFRTACRDATGRAVPWIVGEQERDWLGEAAAGALLPAALQAAADPAGHPDGIDPLARQLARRLFAGEERSVARRLRETLYAVEMERTLDPARRLALLLNTGQWGPGICGARQAARTYFGRPVARLSPLQAAWLAGALRDPQGAWRQRQGIDPPDLARARALLMRLRGVPRAERERAAHEDLGFTSRPAREG
jgi:hypothetical protein